VTDTPGECVSERMSVCVCVYFSCFDLGGSQSLDYQFNYQLCLAIMI
jgi:hypothetical protein